MNLQSIDWLIVVALFVALFAGALYTKRYAKSVSGFLAAKRCAGRYLISVAFNMAQLGVITLVWYFQANYDVGFTTIWWGLLEGPALILMALSGWVIYRFRRTRALTLAEFFERRYSKSFRVFAGLCAFLSGIINYGIFPGVAARFFIALCGFPEHFLFLGITCDTFLVLMLLLMSIALVFVFLGGQVAIIVTDFMQGVFSNYVFMIVMAFLLFTIPWEHIADTLLGKVYEGSVVAVGDPNPIAGRSLLHPFDLGGEDRFNVFYWLISVVILFYGMRAWQGDQGYNAAARTPHEAKMANILNGWRFRVLMLVTLVLPICIRTMLHHPAYVEDASLVHEAVAAYSKESVQSEVRTPLALAVLLPAGLLGLMCAAMIGAFISTNDTYLHSWGAIFIQDVVLPFRKKPLSAKKHLLLLRLSIFGVALFAVLFSYWYEPSQYISMYLALTGAVFVGGAGSAIIGGLYWKKGTAPAAWTAMIVGMLFSGVGIVVKQGFIGRMLAESYEESQGLLTGALLTLHETKWLTGQVLAFFAIVLSILSYVVVSLLTCKRDFDLDKLLHRGQYAVGEDVVEEHEAGFWEKLGFTREFSGRDKWVTWITISWPLIWTVIFVVVTIYNLSVDVPAESWLFFWRYWTWFVFATGFVILCWFTIGGILDLRQMFARMRALRDDEGDHGQLLDPAESERENRAE
ncbi:MAG: sodium:solute symporter [Planctomycetota bacterium]|nr:MAG: sodium:solute symporter [Planctomycetota bacterium]